MQQIIEGLQYLHNQDPQIIHGDLRGVGFSRICHVLNTTDWYILQSNVLVEQVGDTSYSLLLTDFGIAEVTNIATTMTQKDPKGTLRWMAPEVINPTEGKPSILTASSDIYSFAMTCVEVRLLNWVPLPRSFLTTNFFIYRYSLGGYHLAHIAKPLMCCIVLL